MQVFRGVDRARYHINERTAQWAIQRDRQLHAHNLSLVAQEVLRPCCGGGKCKCPHKAKPFDAAELIVLPETISAQAFARGG